MLTEATAAGSAVKSTWRTDSAAGQDGRIGITSSNDRNADLRRLQRRMFQLVLSADSKSELISGHAELLYGFSEPVMVSYFERDDHGALGIALQSSSSEVEIDTQPLASPLLAASQSACRKGEVEVRPHTDPARIIVATPVVLRGRDPEAFAVVLHASDSLEQLLMLIQMAATHFSLWHVLVDGREHQKDARDLAALVEIVEQVDRSSNLHQACRRVAGELQTYLQSARVAVGMRRAGEGPCRLTAISGVNFDKRSKATHAIEAAMDEGVLCEQIIAWPPVDERHHGSLCHKSVCTTAGAKSAMTVPLRDHEGTAVGALTLLDNSPGKSTQSERFMRAVARPLATSLSAVERLEGGRVAKLCRTAYCVWETRKGKFALASVILLLAMMAIPLPLKIYCDCQIEPVTRRFVVTPFEGLLEKAFVQPGDVVSKNDLLARMDGREVRWRRASIVADRSQAVKQRDAAQATHRFADAQIAMLETERLDNQLQLLDHRAEHLEIRSPVAGIVASGDLEWAEGARLPIGRTLFEIAPLDSIIVEVAVADEDISFVRVGRPVYVRLDAYPSEKWQGVVAKVQPRSEIRNEDNVFIADVGLDNHDGRLRPGMKGRARIRASRRPLAWILFHKPWEYVTKKLIW